MAEALALITLTQRSHCDKPGVPYIGVEEDLAAFRRLDPNWISRNSYESNELASFAYWDEYHDANGFFPWINTDYITLPRPPTNYKPHSNRHPLDKGLTWNDANLYDENMKYQSFEEPPDAQIASDSSAGAYSLESSFINTAKTTGDARVCKAKFTDRFLFHDKSLKATCRNRRVRREAFQKQRLKSLIGRGTEAGVDSSRSSGISTINADPYIEERETTQFLNESYSLRLQAPENANNLSIVASATDVPNAEYYAASGFPLVDSGQTSSTLKVYKLKGRVVGLMSISLLVVLLIVRRLLIVWRNRRYEKNLRILLSDLANSEGEKMRLKTERSPIQNSLKAQSVVRHRDLLLLVRTYGLFILCFARKAWNIPKHLWPYLKHQQLKVWIVNGVSRKLKGSSSKRRWNQSIRFEIIDAQSSNKYIGKGDRLSKIQYQAITTKVELCNIPGKNECYSLCRGQTTEIIPSSSFGHLFSTPLSVASTAVLAEEKHSDQFQKCGECINNDNNGIFRFTADTNFVCDETKTPLIVDEDPPPGFEVTSKALQTGSTRDNPFDKIVNEPDLGTLLHHLIVGQDLSPSEVQLLLRIGDMNLD